MSLCIHHNCPGLRCTGNGYGCPNDDITPEAIAVLREKAATYMEGETSWQELDSVAKAARRKRINEARLGE